MNENIVIQQGASKNTTGKWPVLPQCFQNGLIARFIPRVGLFDQISGNAATFARSSTKTGINSIGAPAVLPTNSPSNYQSARDCVYIEPAWTNAITWSNSYTSGHGYTLSNVSDSVSTGDFAICDVNGNPYYATLITATSNGGYVRKTSQSVTTGTKITLSAYIKPVSGNQFIDFSDGTNTFTIYYNPSTDAFYGVVNSGSLAYSTKVEPIVSRPGWLRLSLTITPSATSSSAYFSVGAELNTNAFYLSAMQKVNGPMRGSYVYTEGTSLSTASEGADTSGNGLSIPLSQAMIDSLVGELLDGAVAWTHVSGTAPAYSGGNRILTYAGALTSSDYHALNTTLAVGSEVDVSYTISGYAAGSVALGFGTAAGTARNADGTYTERGTLIGNTNFYVNATGFTGALNILSIRRVLDSGQTNPGEGTCLVAVRWDFPSTVIPSGNSFNSISANNAINSFMYWGRGSTTAYPVRIADGVSGHDALIGADWAAGNYVLLSQYSSTLGRMRVGIFNPSTGALTWSSPSMAGATAYRGFFPIYGTGSQMRLRWGYGLASFPISIGDLYWFNQIINDNELNIILRDGDIRYTSEGYGQQVFIVQDGEYVIDQYGTFVTL